MVPYLHAEESRYEDAHNLENPNEEESVHCGTVFADILLHRDRSRSLEKRLSRKGLTCSRGECSTSVLSTRSVLPLLLQRRHEEEDEASQDLPPSLQDSLILTET